jgi:hypothetical protein
MCSQHVKEPGFETTWIHGPYHVQDSTADFGSLAYEGAITRQLILCAQNVCRRWKPTSSSGLSSRSIKSRASLVPWTARRRASFGLSSASHMAFARAAGISRRHEPAGVAVSNQGRGFRRRSSRQRALRLAEVPRRYTRDRPNGWGRQPNLDQGKS